MELSGTSRTGIVEKFDGRRSSAYLIKFKETEDPKWVDLESVPFEKISAPTTPSRRARSSSRPAAAQANQIVASKKSSPVIMTGRLVLQLLLLSFVIATLGTAYVIDEETLPALAAVSMAMYVVGRM